MFEWEAKDLQAGDEFTIDHGETWLKVLDFMHVDGDPLPVRIYTTSGKRVFLGWTRKVIVR